MTTRYTPIETLLLITTGAIALLIIGVLIERLIAHGWPGWRVLLVWGPVDVVLSGAWVGLFLYLGDS